LCGFLQKAGWVIEVDWHRKLGNIFADRVFDNGPYADFDIWIFEPWELGPLFRHILRIEALRNNLAARILNLAILFALLCILLNRLISQSSLSGWWIDQAVGMAQRNILSIF